MNSSKTGISRRRALRATSVILGTSLAGCGGILDGGSSAQTSTTAPPPTSTPTPSPTRTPDRPSIERQVILRDKAAITHIRRTVTGEITWPSFTTFNIIDPEILGEWRSGDNVLRFSDDGTFEDTGPDFSGQGDYATREGVIFLRYNSGDELTLGYEVTEESGDVYIDFRDESGEPVARYVKTKDGTDERDVVQVFKDTIIVEEENGTTEGGEANTGRAGSGFIVSPDGYIATNAHVVGTHQDPEEALYRRLAVLQRQAIRNLVEEDYDVSDSKKQQLVDVMFDKLISYYAEHSEIGNVSTDVGVLYGSASPEENFEAKSWSAEIETTGSVIEEVEGEPSWGRDIAILKVDQSPLPTVPLGSTTDLGTGEKLFVIGYPELGVEELFEERNTTLEPTLTSGVVSARRTLNSGVSTIQTDAGINHGNSGGPMYNNDGEVVGVATFGPRDVDIQGIQFGLPIEIAKGFLGELGVENEPGELDTAFREGLAAYWRDDCDTVTERMQTVLDLWPDHPYAQRFIDDC